MPVAVAREVQEELGIELTGLELLCAVDQIDHERPEHWVALVHLASRFSGEPRILEPDKHLDWAWFPLEELPAHPEAAPGARLIRWDGASI